ncbi:MAG: TolC family protein [Simkaniaceae bacterium]|nr:TolC family protein [Simkaniaceae bacterium]
MYGIHRRYTLVLLSFLFPFLQGCDIKGAVNPLSYVPNSPGVLWHPPKGVAQPDTSPESTDEDEPTYSEKSSLTLAETIDIALGKNPETKQSWIRARVSATEYGQSLRDEFIRAEASAHYTRTRFSDFTGFDRSVISETRYGTGIKLSYLAFDFGQTRLTAAATLRSLYNAGWSYNVRIQQVVKRITEDYYGYLYSEHLLRVAEENVFNAETACRAARLRFTSGLADVTDTVYARTHYLKRKLARITRKEEMQIAYARLLRNMGLPADKELSFQPYPDPGGEYPPDVETLDALILKAREHRPDLSAARANVEAGILRLRAARKEFAPKAHGTFTIGHQHYRNGLNGSYEFALQGSLDYPLFEGFVAINTIKKTAALLEGWRAKLEAVRLTAIQEVCNERNRVINASESLRIATEYLRSAEANYEANVAKYRAGTTTIVELVNAQTEVADARAERAKRLYDRYTSITDLAYATGHCAGPERTDHI